MQLIQDEDAYFTVNILMILRINYLIWNEPIDLTKIKILLDFTFPQVFIQFHMRTLNF